MRRMPPKLSIYARIPLNKSLVDRRIYSGGLVFGKIRDVARQYNIDIELLETCYKFSAPRSHLQMFAEKLNFSGVSYSYQDPNPPKRSK